MDVPHLSIRNLSTCFYSPEKSAFVHAVENVSFDIKRGKTLGIVGESGSGKSVAMLSIMGLLGTQPGVISGEVIYNRGNDSINLLQDLDRYITIEGELHNPLHVHKNEVAWNKKHKQNIKGVLGRDISMIFQNPKAALNPFETIGQQMIESIRMHTEFKTKAEARDRAIYWLQKVRIDEPEQRLNNYPYGLSGGMCQRAMIAMALASEPKVLIADEPTTGLDATIQARIIDLLAELQDELGITLILISHDMSVISRLSDEVAVMYSGQLLEHGPTTEILDKTNKNRHPYTSALLASIPSGNNVLPNGHLPTIPGELPDNIVLPPGCRFSDRCPKVTDQIREKCAKKTPTPFTKNENHIIRCWHYE